MHAGGNEMYNGKMISSLTEKGFTTTEAASAVRSILEIISETLEAGEPVALKGFGIFRVYEFSPYMTRHLRTGEPLRVQSHRRVIFTPGKPMKRMINK